MAKIKITQVKSSIGATTRQKLTLEALGLKKLNQPKVHEDTATIKGMVAKLSHLVKVEEIETN